MDFKKYEIRGELIMNEFLIEYVSVLLTNSNEDDNRLLRNEHKKVLKKITGK